MMQKFRQINPYIFTKVRAALIRTYIMRGQAVPPQEVEKDPSLSYLINIGMINPRTVERTMRVMAQRKMIEKTRRGFYKPNGMKFERNMKLEEFA